MLHVTLFVLVVVSQFVLYTLLCIRGIRLATEKVSLHATMLSGSVPEALCEFRQTGHLEYFTANCIGNYTYYLDDESDEPPMEIADTDNSSGPLPYMACTCCTLCF